MTNYYEDILQPAVQMTMGVLKSAAKTESIKRIVMTSSVVALDFAKTGRIGGQSLGSSFSSVQNLT
jgi:nucleoside-diphosphate-sugar epimerase